MRTTTTHSSGISCDLGTTEKPQLEGRTEASSQTPKTPEIMLLAMVALVSCVVTGANVNLYWANVPDPPLARRLMWIDPSPTTWVKDSHWFPDPNRAPSNLAQQEPYIIILDS